MIKDKMYRTTEFENGMNYSHSYKKNIVFLLSDVVVLCFAYLVIHYLLNSSLSLEPRNRVLLGVILVSWFIMVVYYQKYNILIEKNLVILLRRNFYIIFASLFFIAFFLIFIQKYNVSRKLLFGTFILYAILDSFLLTLFSKFNYGIDVHRENEVQKNEKNVFRWNSRLFFLDLISIPSGFYLINFLKREKFELSPEYEKIFWVLFGTWIIGSLFTKRYFRQRNGNIYHSISDQIRAFVVSMSLLSIFLYTTYFFQYSRLQLYGTLLFTLITNLGYVLMVFSGKFYSNRDIEDIELAKSIVLEEEYDIPPPQKAKKPLHKKIEFLKKEGYNQIADLIQNMLPLKQIEEDKSILLNTRTLFNILSLDNSSSQLLVNLHKLNDVRYINKYFLTVHTKLLPGGYFVGYSHTIQTHSQWMREKFPRILFVMVYPFDFLWHRMLPKLPFFKKIYFFLSRGYNRLLSRAEILGRLVFCGFEIVYEEEINNRMVFIARKKKNPSMDKNPSYSPVIRLKRIGLNGDTFYLRKFRTMYPYSEYLQDYVHKTLSMDDSGKFKNDFRVTEYGKWFRKFWIDELPQLINWIEGDVTLVGVRALSQHYFSLYPEEVQKLRIQFKPGLVPPYYADMPKSFDEIVESERRYLLQKQKSPILTDVKYFFKAFFNIFFRNARSK